MPMIMRNPFLVAIATLSLLPAVNAAHAHGVVDHAEPKAEA